MLKREFIVTVLLLGSCVALNLVLMTRLMRPREERIVLPDGTVRVLREQCFSRPVGTSVSRVCYMAPVEPSARGGSR